MNKLELMQDINITTKLIYFYEDQFAFFRAIAMHAMKLAYGKNIDKANLPDLLLLLMRKHGKKPFNIEYEEPTNKHNKTNLLYFSEEEHKYFTEHIASAIPKDLTPKQKRLATTRIIIRLLVDYIIWKTGDDSDIKKIYKRVMKSIKNEQSAKRY